MLSGDCSLLLNWCFKVEKCFTYRWYINNWEHSSGLSLAIFFSLGCFGNGRSKFWVQGVASAVLMLFWHCFYCDWIAVESGQGLPVWNWLIRNICLTWCFLEILCLLYVYMLISYTVCLWCTQLYLEKGIVTYDPSVWKICFALSSSVMSIQIWKLH